MNHNLIDEQLCSVTISDNTVYIDSYQISAEKKYTFQPMAVSGIKFSELGFHPAIVKIKGKVLKEDGVNPAVRFNNDIKQSVLYNLSFDNLYFNAMVMRKFNMLTEINSSFIQVEFEFYCDSYISGGE